MTAPSGDQPQPGLQWHLQAQRNAATRLIDAHNRLLSAMLGTGSAPAGATTIDQSSATPTPVAVPVKPANKISRGNVINLFDYVPGAAETAPDTVANGTVPVDTDAADVSVEAPAYQLFDENDAAARQAFGADIDALLASYGADDALAINRKHMAGTIFLPEARDCLFYLRQDAGILFVVCYVGPDACYRGGLLVLQEYASSAQLQINLMAQEDRVTTLKDCGFSTTPMGIWQRIEPLSDFTLKGSKMRRLRYLVGKYGGQGTCHTQEYVPGDKPEFDNTICKVIDQWCELKGQVPPYVPGVKEQVLAGGIGPEHRFFLTFREDLLDNVIVFSRDNFNDGYLMDLEFYADGMPLGSTEFALTEIIKTFAREGRKQVSLGLTMGTGLFEHENGSHDVHQLFDSLRKADYVNGDANAQYKNKYRPQTTTMYLARPADSGKSKLNDLMLLLGTG